MTELTRRRLVATAGVLGTGVIAGCTSSADGAGVTEGTVLGEISVENLHADEHTVDVIVEYDGEIEHWSSHVLDGGDGTSLNRNWPTGPGEFRVTTRLNGEELAEVTPDQWNEPSCLNLVILIRRDGSVAVSAATRGGECAPAVTDDEE